MASISKTRLQRIFLVGFLGLASVTPLSRVRAEPPRWKIGVIAPLSGEIAEWGLDTRRAIEVANELLGNSQFELIFEDDRCLGKAAVNSAHKLLDVDRINFGMLVCSESTISTSPLFEKAKVLVVAPAATADIISNAGEYIFRTWPKDREMANAIMNELRGKQSRLAIISENRGFPQEFARSLITASQQLAIKVTNADFDSQTSDFRSILLRLQTQSSNALLINTDSASNAVQMSGAK